MKVFIYDLSRRSCFSNMHLSVCLRRFCARNGYTVTENRGEADIVVINGCNIQKRNLEIIDDCRRALQVFPHRRVIAVGCVPPMKADAGRNFHILPLKKMIRDPSAVDRLFGAANRFEMIPMSDALHGSSLDMPAVLSKLFGDFAPLKITDGCQGRCSYCVYPQAKGRIRSVPLKRVLAEFDRLAGKNGHHVALISDDTLSWGRDIGTDITTLLAGLLKRSPGCRLGANSFHPCLLRRMLGRLRPFLGNFAGFTLPIQSGNDRILRLMNRGHTAGETLELVAQLRAEYPGLWINTDIIVGFPTETFPEFMDSVRAARSFDSVSFLAFVAYPSTAAGRMKRQVPDREIERRMRVIRRMGRRFHFFTNSPLSTGSSSGAESPK